MISASIIGLYAWSHFALPGLRTEPIVFNYFSAGLAIVCALICIASYIRIPLKAIVPVSISIFITGATSIALLIIDNGGTTSPFIALWLMAGAFAGIFGVIGWMPYLISTGVFTAFQYINGDLNSSAMIVIILSSIMPLIAGGIIWHDAYPKADVDTSEKAYKNLANELNEVASKSEVVINAIGDGVIALNSQGIIELINPAAQTLIGWGKQDALGLNYKSVLKLVDDRDQALTDTADPVQQVINSNQQVRNNNFSLLTSSGKKIMISLVVSPVGETGSGVIAVFHDITKEKADEREQAEFISTASHEMRTPVASIEGYLGLALNPQTAQVDDRARDFIMKAHASAEHLGHLFQDLLDISKFEDGRLTNNPVVTDIVPFVHDIVEGLRQKAKEKGLPLIYRPMPGEDNHVKIIAPDYMAYVDENHLREIVSNLVENAIKYTQQGEVNVDVNGDDDHIVISVADSGIGIPAEDIPHLFQKFYRVDNEHTHDIGGTGLGLFLSRRLTEAMGGRIWVESTYEKGSTFYIELPRTNSQEAERLAEQANSILQPTNTGIETPSIQIADNKPQSMAPQLNSVPRGEALTPEQIAAYAAKQHELAQQQNAQQNESQ